MKIADLIGLSGPEKSALFYALLLKDLGCSSNAAKMCWLFEADDRSVKRNFKLIDWARLTSSGLFAFRNAKPDAGCLERIKKVVGLARSGKEQGRNLVKVRCERGADIVRMLGSPEATANATLCLDEHWDGNGHPLGLRRDKISLLGRICCLAQTVEVFVTSYGFRDAIAIAKRRKGTWFDPELETPW